MRIRCRLYSEIVVMRNIRMRMKNTRRQSVMIEQVEPRELFSTYTVTTNADSGAGSFRDALIKANSKSDTDTIKFNISGSKKIVFKSSVPFVLYPVIIDGTSQPGYAGKPLIELSGEATSGDGIRLGGGNSTVKGLVINKFKGNGMIIVNNGGNTIKGNWIGTDITGTKDYGNGKAGIVVSKGTNVIGGPNASDRNIISGNTQLGLQFWTSNTNNNLVKNNYIGTDVTGNVAIPNDGSGVVINGSTNNVVDGNVISGNKQDGLVMNLSGGTGKNNKVINNIVGLNAAGNARLANLNYGIETSTAFNTINNNVVSGNAYSGIVLWLKSGSNNIVQGNLVGTDKTGTKDIGNWWRGIDVSNGSSDNLIGGTGAGQRNVISGNDEWGVLDYQGFNNKFINNLVGTDITGTKNVKNFGDGFRLVQANNVLIQGGTIGYNTGYAVHNGASKNTKVTGVKLINNVLFLVKMT